MRGLFSRLVGSRSVASGAALYIAMRWFDRSIGVVSTIVLARLLTAADFGIVALASIALGLAVVLLDLGINLTVVQRRNIDRDELDTAWTLRLLQNVAVAAVLALSSPWVADYYHDPRLAPVIVTLAFAYLLDGLTGLGPIVFQKRQEYAREVAFFMAKRAIGFAATVVLALWLRSYWALVVGTVLSNVAGVVLSYVMHPAAPRFTLSRWRDFLGASSWLTIRAIGSFATSQLDKLVVGRRDGPTMLGAYSLADQISAMPASELLAPTSRALFPAMAASQEDRPKLRRIYLSALGIQCSLALPASVGLALVAADMVPVVLGEKWGQAVPLMTALALAYGANSLTSAGNYLMVSLGDFRTQAVLQWAMAAVLAALIFAAFPQSGANEIAWFRVALGGLGIVAVAALVRRRLPIVTFADMLRQTARPVIATAVMSVAVAGVQYAGGTLSTWLRLVAEVASGAVVYAAALAGLWHLAGRPDGAERWALQRARSLLARS
ncbi:MAG: lipopolysaccharide biosynthesis protein [Alphaproteobacteria bacterium]|nr:MAG: lipopolysaccharide biosynthesis protein [Alphaproteobacteria bacterium]